MIRINAADFVREPSTILRRAAVQPIEVERDGRVVAVIACPREEPDPRDAELASLRARVAELEAALSSGLAIVRSVHDRMCTSRHDIGCDRPMYEDCGCGSSEYDGAAEWIESADALLAKGGRDG